ncbi:hypothetical protein [Desulfospira joergensenii]|uniref:hypothetical protein n=1 Tax=Desulfospira joergensenii TaxID=53329 RepID=UPI0003B74CE0|nr:hypothetical protein [Desulfospira joergensenii]
MVNINQINESAQTLGGAEKKPSKDQNTDAFKDALSKAIDKTEASEMGTTSSPALEEIESAYVQIQGQSSIVTGETDKLLGLLDTLAAQLEDPGISLKSMAPVVEELNENASALLKETESLGQEESDLKEIATRTAVTAQNEYIKFQRGDYLS